MMRAACLLCFVVLLGACPTAALAAPSLRLGFLDDVQTGPLETSGPWLARSVASGSDVVRISNGWGSLAPRRPIAPTDPADPAYDWASLDQAVRVVDSAGLAPLVSLTGAPDWAQGRGKPGDVVTQAWKPDPRAFAAFAQALARRYDGTYPDPSLVGALLPRVRAFQPWNEPNLELYLAPQWERRGGRFTNTGPVIYRNLLNGFYRGVKASQPRATVVSAGTAPFGDPRPGGKRTMPARFVRGMLCLDRRLRAVCAQRTHFDAIAHHPYSVGAPTRRALNADDVSIPDLAKITRPVAAAVRLGRALPRRSKSLWITEVSYDSSPPDPNGVPLATHARYLEQALALLQRQGARVITWFQIRDQAPEPSYAASNQSGVYFRDGRAKPAQTAFAFPVVVTGSTARRVRLWFRAPGAGPVRLERRVGGVWRATGTVRAARHAVVERWVARGGASAFRARQGTATSLAWKL